MGTGVRIMLAVSAVLLLGGCTKELWEQPLKEEWVEQRREPEQIRFFGQTDGQRIVLGGREKYYVLDAADSRKLQAFLHDDWPSAFGISDGQSGRTVKIHIRADKPQRFYAPIALHYRAGSERERARLRALHFIVSRNEPDDFINSYGLSGDVYAAPPQENGRAAARSLQIPAEIVYSAPEVKDGGKQIAEKVVLTPFALLLDAVTLPLKMQDR